MLVAADTSAVNVIKTKRAVDGWPRHTGRIEVNNTPEEISNETLAPASSAIPHSTEPFNFDPFSFDPLYNLSLNNDWFASTDTDNTLELMFGHNEEASPDLSFNGIDCTIESFSRSDMSMGTCSNNECESAPLHSFEAPRDGTTHQNPRETNGSPFCPPQYARKSQSPSRQIWDWEPLVVDYFFTEVVPLYSLFDSKANPLRQILERVWQTSEPVYHALKSMAALCLASDFPDLSSVAKRERTEALICVDKPHTAITREELLLTYIMIGHTSSWHRSDDLSLTCFTKSRNILEDWSKEGSSSLDRSFFWDFLKFWRMLLAFVTDEVQHVKFAEAVVLGPKTIAYCSLPHPWTGIAPDMIDNLAEVGTLIHSLRTRLRPTTFLSMADVQYVQNAVTRARQLESTLLGYRSADLTTILDPGDSHTPKTHLKDICEAYRALALLLLYRAFPDLLSQRYWPWEEDDLLQPRPTLTQLDGNDRDTWLTHLALHVISILENIPFESRTRSVQPFIFIAVATELRLAPRGKTRGTEDRNHPLYFRAVRARRFIRSRLSAYKHMLPIEKTRMFYNITEKLWSEVDGGDCTAYWMDILSRKGLGTILG